MASLVVFLLLLAGAHPDSLSRSRVRVEGARVALELRFQSLSLFEVWPEFDPNHDRLLDPAEAEAERVAIAAYLAGAFRLAEVLEGREVPLEGRLMELTPEDPAALGVFELQNVVARFEYAASAPLERLAIESALFHETNPWHKDTCFVAWNDEAEVPHVFSGDRARFLFEPARVRRPGVLALYFRLGLDHIRTGFDHLAFLLALLVASRRLRTLVGVVTAFTLAHSLTLALAAVGWVRVPGNFVELAIALSIAYVACDNLLRGVARSPWAEAFLFGLLHGLGFAGFLKEQLEGEPLLLTALLGFNLGVEAGQLALVGAAAGVAFGLGRVLRWKKGETDGIVPKLVRVVVSIAVACAGFYWFLERAGWLG